MGVEVQVVTGAGTLRMGDTMITTVAEVVEDMVVNMADEVVLIPVAEVATSTAIKVDPDLIPEVAVPVGKGAILSALATGPAHHAALTTLHPASSACDVGWPSLCSGILRQRHPTMVAQ